MSVPISEFMLSRSKKLLEGTEVVTHGVRGRSIVYVLDPAAGQT